MSDFMKLSLTRQSCRNYSTQPVEHEKLVQIIEAAHQSPSACNSQPWSFVVAETPDVVSKIAVAAQQLGINAFLSNAQAFVIILETHALLAPGIRKLIDSQYFAKADCGGATMSVCLAAADLGLGSCIIGMFDREAITNAAGLPADTRFASLIAIGYPADETIREKKRKDLSTIVKYV